MIFIFSLAEKKKLANISFKTIKDSLNNLLRFPQHLSIIENAVQRSNTLIAHGYQFLKLLLLYHMDKNLEFPEVNTKLMRNIYSCIANKRSNKPLLNEFYQHFYSKLVPPNENIDYMNLPNILCYSAIDSIKNIENNVVMRFEQHLRKFVECYFQYRERKKWIQETYPTNQRKIHYQQLDRVIELFYTDLLPTTPVLQSPVEYHDTIKKLRSYLFPYPVQDPTKNLLYDITAQKSVYLRSMFALHNLCETQLKETSSYSFNVLPLKTSTAPGYITIDTTILIDLFFDRNGITYCKKDFKLGNNKFIYWNRFFDLYKPTFRKGKQNSFKFHYMILTDGVGCSVVFSSPVKPEEPVPDQYFEDLRDRPNLMSKHLICIDPGQSDLIYCRGFDFPGVKTKTFRYTQNQRRKELRIKKYRYIRLKLGQHIQARDIDGQTRKLQEFQKRLCLYSAKTCNFNKFAEYCRYKNLTNFLLRDFYNEPTHRKLKWYSFINRQKSESKMIRNFKNRLGKPENTVIVYGDWSKGSSHQPGTEPTISKRIKMLLKKEKYELYLINEYKTSKVCNGCGGELEKFLRRPKKTGYWKRGKKKGKVDQKQKKWVEYSKQLSSLKEVKEAKGTGSKEKRPYEKEVENLCHGLLRCTNTACFTIHNRDKNAVKNMLKITWQVFCGRGRPAEYCRIADSSTAHEVESKVLV